MSDGLQPSTRMVALGRPDRTPGAPVNPPVTFTSTYVADGDVDYGRVSNPTWEALEEVLGSLEGGRARTFASGLAAIAAALSLVPHGGVVVAPHHVYSGSAGLLAEGEASGGLQLRRVPAEEVDTIVDACQGAELLLLESPTNPMLEVTDIAAVVRGLQDRYGDRRPVVVCDNTFATPLLQRPLEHGADVVVHSATKFLSGHSDTVLGAAVVSNRRPDLLERLTTYRTLHGAVPGPMEAWLVLRGVRTLQVRLERAASNAAVLAGRLQVHPAVVVVRYPGFGAMISIEVRPGGGSHEAAVSEDDGAQVAEAVCAATALWTHSTSLGGVESQLERRRRHGAEAQTVPPSLIRLSVGIEDVDDLWDDLSRALDLAGQSSSPRV